MALMQLIYVSIAREWVGSAELSDILHESVANNGRDGVTGMLLHSAGSFVQVLEGEEDVVLQTYARIVDDPRHYNCTVISRMVVKAREFGSWHMGYSDLSTAAADRHPQWAPYFEKGFDPTLIGVRPGVALLMLRSFADEQRVQ